MGVNIRYEHMTILMPNRPPERGRPADVRNDGRYDRMDCKYCYTDDVQPVTLYEKVDGLPPHEMPICPNCGAGLGPGDDIPPEAIGLIGSMEAFELEHIED